MMKLRGQLLLLLICAITLTVIYVYRTPYNVRAGSAVVVGATAALVMLTSRSRLRLGVQGTRGEAMLFDLRERLRAQGRVPKLPSDWHIDMSIRSAGGQSFAGDFLIAALGRNNTEGPPGSTLELGLVDVSGKGLNAGTRALLLSGAFGGLLGTVPSREFLTAANKYLIRQDWEEGFATSVHLVIELETGQYRFHSAGHPPIARLTAKTGRWSIEEAEGPLLGVIEDSEFPATEGCLDRGDALLLFTDGLVERPGRDLEVGIDRLLGAAETHLTGGFEGGADRLISEVAHDVRDDRALVVVWRT
jgi:Stage II sporulation protein E (SpoIIE)